MYIYMYVCVCVCERERERERERVRVITLLALLVQNYKSCGARTNVQILTHFYDTRAREQQGGGAVVDPCIRGGGA
jgi:hypothetical protein